MARPKNLDFIKRPFDDIATRLGDEVHGVAGVSFRLDAESLQALKTAQRLLSKALDRHVIPSTVFREALKAFAGMVQQTYAEWEKDKQQTEQE
jgi:hypothetical protein